MACGRDFCAFLSSTHSAAGEEEEDEEVLADEGVSVVLVSQIALHGRIRHFLIACIQCSILELQTVVSLPSYFRMLATLCACIFIIF